MSPGNQSRLRPPQAVGYRHPRDDLAAARTRAAQRFLAILSLRIGCGYLVVAAAAMVGDTRGLPRWTFGAAIVRHWSDDPVGFVFCASLVAIALLLIVAGATLVSGSIAAGKTLHWIYVWLQLVASIMVTYRTLGEFSMSPAAPIAPLVALALGSVSAAYPVVLMFELNNKSNWQVCHWDEEIEE